MLGTISVKLSIVLFIAKQLADGEILQKYLPFYQIFWSGVFVWIHNRFEFRKLSLRQYMVWVLSSSFSVTLKNKKKSQATLNVLK